MKKLLVILSLAGFLLLAGGAWFLYEQIDVEEEKEEEKIDFGVVFSEEGQLLEDEAYRLLAIEEYAESESKFRAMLKVDPGRIFWNAVGMRDAMQGQGKDPGDLLGKMIMDTWFDIPHELADEPKNAALIAAKADFKEFMDEYEEAEALIRRAIKLEPNRARHHGILGHLLEDADRIQSFRKAVELDPENPWHRIDLFWSLWDDGHLDEAEAEAREALKLCGDNVEGLDAILPTFYGYAELSEDLENDSEGFERGLKLAEEFLSEFAEQNPENHIGQLLIGEFLFRTGDSEGARSYFEKARNLKADSKRVAEAFQHLD